MYIIETAMKLIKIAVIVALAAGVASCCSCLKGKSKIAPFNDTRWQLVQIGNRGVNTGTGASTGTSTGTGTGAGATTGGDNYFVTFGKEGTVNGRGDCNSFNGSYQSADKSANRGNIMGTISVGMIASTRKMCPDQEMETKFFETLRSATGYIIDGDILMLQRDGDTVMVFQSK